ncbi:enoyl-CoA hydratase/isomerase family protein [Actinophytocola sp.]|uniref:enoyl-CoA hydratase/isomerase family protein n=1 Tax=Actinophytocola sp. TaxID=1872138 RepID=UPI0025C6D2E9|nr:enoyl-CoA hydratase/isomerase family protein [Actinophytocola sp.]
MTRVPAPVDDDRASGDGVSVERPEEGIAVVTLDRPAKLNAIDWAMHERIPDVLAELGGEESVSVIVLRGAGRAFSVGGDVTLMADMVSDTRSMAAVHRSAVRLFHELVTVPQPTIAVVDGPAIGLGATIALACDLVYAGPSASFSDPHVQMGLVPGDGGVIVWPLLLGPARAKRFLMTGDRLNAAEAAALGLAEAVTDTDSAFEPAMRMARRLAAGPSFAIQATKSLVNHYIRDAAERLLRPSLVLEARSQETDYHARAVATFLAGGRPRF